MCISAVHTCGDRSINLFAVPPRLTAVLAAAGPVIDPDEVEPVSGIVAVIAVLVRRAS